MRQGIPQVTHPRGGDRQRATARTPLGGLGALQAQVELVLASDQALTRGGLQDLQLSLVMGRPDVLDIPRPPPGGVHDLHGRRSRRGLHRAQVRGHEPTLRARISAQIRSRQSAKPQVSEPHALPAAKRVTSQAALDMATPAGKAAIQQPA
jgi:hypothetical protein